MRPESAVLRESLKNLEKMLYKVSSRFGDPEDLASDFKKINDTFSEIRRIVEEYPYLEGDVAVLVDSMGLLPVFKEVSEKLWRIQRILEDYLRDMEDVDEFLEKYRTYRYYSFPSMDSTVKFILGAAGENRILFRPVMIGEVSLEKLSQETGFPQEDRHLSVPRDGVRKIMEHMARNYPSAAYRFELGDISLTYRPDEGLIYAEGSPRHIRELDILAHKVGGRYLNR